MNSHNVNGPIDAVFFMLSYKCNLKCDFCIVNSPQVSLHRHSILDTAVASRYAERVRVSGGPPSTKFIFFYGGEPTLHWQRICGLTRALIELHPDYQHFRYVVITNGLVPVKCWNDFPLLSRLEVRISISGIQFLGKLIEVADVLRDTGAYVNFNVTIDSADPQPWLHIIQTLRGQGLAFLINPLRGAAAREKFSTHDELSAYIACIRTLYEQAMNWNAQEFRILNVRRAIRDGSPIEKDCFLDGGRQIIVLPDGGFTTCFDDLTTEDLRWSEDTINALGELTTSYYPIDDPECAACPVQRYCSTGCARQIKAPDGAGWVRDHIICNITKTITARELGDGGI